MTGLTARLAFVAATTTLLLATGCGLPPAAPDTTSPSPAPSGPPAASPQPGTSSSSAPAPTASTTPAPREAFAVLRGSLEEVPVVAEVYPVHREGATSTLNVRLTGKRPGAEFRILDALNDRNPETGARSNTAPDALRLIDPQAKKGYLPATTGQGDCVCSPATNGWMDHYTDVTVSATFAAPPASRTTIDVMIPGFGTVNDVPLV